MQTSYSPKTSMGGSSQTGLRGCAALTLIICTTLRAAAQDFPSPAKQARPFP